jgi:hypothetical protein
MGVFPAIDIVRRLRAVKRGRGLSHEAAIVIERARSNAEAIKTLVRHMENEELRSAIEAICDDVIQRRA